MGKVEGDDGKAHTGREFRKYRLTKQLRNVSEKRSHPILRRLALRENNEEKRLNTSRL